MHYGICLYRGKSCYVETVVKVNQQIDMSSSLVYMGCTEYQFKRNEYSLPKK